MMEPSNKLKLFFKEYLEMENYHKFSAEESENKIDVIMQNLIELEKVFTE